ncbi:protein-export chaperone SecB, partial [Enterococcus hirae]
MTDNDQGNENSVDSRRFAAQKIYVKDISFEAPNSPAIFSTDGKPEISQHIGNMSNKLDDNIYEVQISIT